MNRVVWMFLAGLMVVAAVAPYAEAQRRGRMPRVPTEWPPKDEFPQTAGVHHLSFDVEFEGETRQHSYGLYVPPGLEEGQTRPMLVYLVGRGERGNHVRQLYMLGPLSEMERSTALKNWVDFFILIPQCPTDTQYETPLMGHVVAEATRVVVDKWPVDKNAVHLAGMSMGGEGVWHAALAGPGLYASVNAMGGRAHPDPQAVAKAMKGTTAWVIVGARDGDFTTGSKRMVDALTEEGVDVVHTVIPGFSHNIWRPVMSKRQWYEYILQHRRDQAPPTDRPTGEQMAEIAYLTSADEESERFYKDLNEQFEKWLPHWQLENCGRVGGVGQQDHYGDAKNVFLTHPLSPMSPCRIMTTWPIPEGKTTTLHLRVGRHPRGTWQLIVQLNNEAVIDRLIDGVRDRENTRELFENFEIDLTPYAGEKVEIQLFNQATSWRREHAVWERIEIISK